MRRILRILPCAALMAGGAMVCAQQPARSPQSYPQQPQQQPPYSQSQQMPQQAPDTQHQPAAPKVKTVKLKGTVAAYDAGKSIQINAKGGTRNYDLTASNMTVTVAPDVKVGSKVKVTEKPDGSGHTTVDVESK